MRGRGISEPSVHLIFANKFVRRSLKLRIRTFFYLKNFNQFMLDFLLIDLPVMKQSKEMFSMSSKKNVDCKKFKNLDN